MGAKWVSKTFTTTGGTQSWVCPAGVTVVFLRGVGAGGGGGKGLAGSTSINVCGGGGGGGGAARETTVPVDVIPGHTYYINIGVPGTGANVIGVDGGDGTDTIFWDSIFGIGNPDNGAMARFVGAHGGKTCTTLNNDSPGGDPVRFDQAFWNSFVPQLGSGGFGGFQGDGDLFGQPGFPSDGGAGYAASGFNSGAYGAASGSLRGGGGGGGGGFSTDYQGGGVGGAGGAAGGGGTGTAGSVGGDATTYGSGGGGGGGGGSAGVTPGAGGNGGNGGAGRLVIEWVE